MTDVTPYRFFEVTDCDLLFQVQVDSLGTIGGDLLLQGNAVLNSTEPMIGITSIGGGFGVLTCAALAELKMHFLGSIGGELLLDGSIMWTNLDTLGGLTAIPDYLYVVAVSGRASGWRY